VPPTLTCDLTALITLMEKLRDPVTGCPWDRRQNFHTIAPYTIEEAYEVADAIARGDMARLKDELGDLLFQVVFHAQMAREQGSFCVSDVVEAIVTKMVRRHPHVFSGARSTGPEALEDSWESIKAAERIAAGDPAESLMDGIAAGLPGLIRAGKLQKQAARCGFDWPQLASVLAKLREEISELEEAISRRDEGAKAAMNSELGDVLFSVVNVARHLGLDAEASLAAANSRFEWRFRTMEELQEQDSGGLAALSAAELETLWRAAKTKEAQVDR